MSIEREELQSYLDELEEKNAQVECFALVLGFFQARLNIYREKLNRIQNEIDNPSYDKTAQMVFRKIRKILNEG